MPNRILLVEDDPTSRRYMAIILTQMGYGVASAASGEEALHYLYSEEQCDLVLSDIAMPGMSGTELARRAGDARPGIPFIFVSGFAEAIDKAMDVGVFVLPKPLTRFTLTRIIGDALHS